MPKVNKEKIPVHYVWIGPPSESLASSGIAGHDIEAMIKLWDTIAVQNTHPIFFWCLDEFVTTYEALLAAFIWE